MTYGDFMAEEQKVRIQAIKDSEFRAANDDGEPASDLAGVGPSSLSPPGFLQDLSDAADDLDRLEELEPRPGRVGLANRLRAATSSWHTVSVRQDATGGSVIVMAGNPLADAADNLKSGSYLVFGPIEEET